MHRIFIQDSALLQRPLVVRDEKAHYLFSVLRCKPGDCLIVTNEKGKSYTAQILTASRKEVTADITGDSVINTESTLNITLIQGLLKGEKMDFVIQKTTELGVNAIVPVITERSQIRETRKLPRWKKIAEEASRQCGRNVVPEILSPFAFEDIFNFPGLQEREGIIFWEKGGQRLSAVTGRLRNADRLSLFIGPEGGFSDKEVNTAVAHGICTATLGNRIL
ncbi:MAG: 16S rRNA (uracil(1498)-N(3))-methyltransferase, partial [Nitrospirota bacterium]|nr:16S rRNA (uracil(1498)-N(3))-methyltransferase [Nitrospirota bacterium]